MGKHFCAFNRPDLAKIYLAYPGKNNSRRRFHVQSNGWACPQNCSTTTNYLMDSQGCVGQAKLNCQSTNLDDAILAIEPAPTIVGRTSNSVQHNDTRFVVGNRLLDFRISQCQIHREPRSRILLVSITQQMQDNRLPASIPIRPR